MEQLDTKDFYVLHQKHPHLKILDVRETQEFNSFHYEKAISCPLSSLDVEGITKQLNLQKTQPLYLICLSGGRSQKAAHLFMDYGFVTVVNIVGGMSSWERNGLPVVRLG